MSDKGFLKIDRSLFNHWLWEDKPFSKGAAWIDLISLANYKSIKKTVGDKVITYKRGTVFRSILYLADRWGWDRKKVKRFLSVLERDQMLSVNSTTHGTTITIINYSKYQDKRSTDGTSNGQPMDNRWDNNSPQEKERKERKERNIYGARVPTQFPPSIETISKYIKEHKLKVTPERFRDYYEARGWRLAKGRKMTSEEDWHGALMSWEEETDGGDKNTGHFEYERNVGYDEIERQLIAAQRARR